MTTSPAIATYSGRMVNIFDFKAEDVDIESIAHALSNICRYGGHAAEFYSVAQHSTLLSEVVPPYLRRAALLHDAAEAYIGDLPRPIKKQFPLFEQLDASITMVIFGRFGVSPELLIELHQYDLRICVDEMQALMPELPDEFSSRHLGPPLGVEILPDGPFTSKSRFLVRFRELFA